MKINIDKIDDNIDELILSSDPDFIKAAMMIVYALEKTNMDFSKVRKIKEFL